MRLVIRAFGYLLSHTARKFATALEQPQLAQQQVKRKLTERLKRCDYGRQHQIRSIEDWHKLPIVSYEDLQPWIEDSLNHDCPLTPEKILFYEPTSGSSGPVKRIPYTRSLRKSFNRLFCVWAHDLIINGPAFSRGKLYFSITPSFSKSAIDTGTTDDADYLDPWLRWLLKPFLVIAPKTATPEEFKDQLAQTLLLAEDLEIISIWSPSFLTTQLDYIQQNRERLCKVLKGEMGETRSHLLLSPNIQWSALWPNLKLISCWDSALAADGADGLRSRFPNVLVQGKGLLATEAPMTVPLIAAQGDVPLLNEVYFEFEDDAGQCHELHQLTVGQTYVVIISQTGGLYRYRIGDRVKVSHFYKQTPCLEFQGRGKDISDMVGEKLHAQFVSSVLNRLNLSPAQFQSLVPVQSPQKHYALLLDKLSADRDLLAHQLEEYLCESFHYRQARQLGQLASAKVKVSATVAEQLATERTSEGQRWGDVKHSRLCSRHFKDLAFLS